MSLKLNWPNRILLYSTVLIGLAVLMTTYITYRTAAGLWEREFLERNSAYAKYTSLDVLRIFGGNFNGGEDDVLAGEIRSLTDLNSDLLGVMILTPSGRPLFETLPEELRNSLDGSWTNGLPSAVSEVVGTGQPMTRKGRTGGHRTLDIIAPVSGQGGTRPVAVRYIFSYESLDAKTASLIRRVAAGAGGLLAVGLLFSTYLSRGLVRPVRILSGGAARIAAGDRDHRIELTTGDELETLAHEFNRMLDSLSQQQDELESANLELETANRRLLGLQDQLLRSERLAALGQLSAGVSHELDNPVGVILGYAELLDEELANDTVSREYAMAILAEAKRCKRIIAGLLDFSRPTRSEAQQVDLRSMVSGFLDQLGAQRTFRKINFDFAAQEGSYPVEVDPDSLRQVLLNLSLNSAQSMGEVGSISLDIRSEGNGERDGFLMTFKDTGPGIPDELACKVFDPFFTTKRRGEGTGLGLSICRKLVEEAGGWIEVRRTRDEGGSLEVWLPSASVDD